jgi:hypothetical protein
MNYLKSKQVIYIFFLFIIDSWNTFKKILFNVEQINELKKENVDLKLKVNTVNEDLQLSLNRSQIINQNKLSDVTSMYIIFY